MTELDLGCRRCARCGKEFDVPWPTQYRYRRGMLFLCSWSCLRAYDRSEEERIMNRKKLTLEQKKKAVEIAIAGGSPFDYLAKCGSKDPYSAWKSIKNTLKEADPAMFAKLPKRIMPQKEEAGPERTVSAEVTEDIAKEPETRAETKPLNYDGFTVTSLKGRFGEWHMDAQHNSLDFRGADGEEMYMRPEAWREFTRELERVMAILGA